MDISGVLVTLAATAGSGGKHLTAEHKDAGGYQIGVSGELVIIKTLLAVDPHTLAPAKQAIGAITYAPGAWVKVELINPRNERLAPVQIANIDELKAKAAAKKVN